MPAYTKVVIKEGTKGIVSGAFEDCSGLTSIAIPSSVTSIGFGAFSSCSGLTSIYCYAKTPPTCYDIENKESITLYVPASSVEMYKKSSPWKEFKKIVAIP